MWIKSAFYLTYPPPLSINPSDKHQHLLFVSVLILTLVLQHPKHKSWFWSLRLPSQTSLQIWLSNLSLLNPCRSAQNWSEDFYQISLFIPSETHQTAISNNHKPTFKTIICDERNSSHWEIPQTTTKPQTKHTVAGIIPTGADVSPK